MDNKIKFITSLFLIPLLVGCSTTTTRSIESIDTKATSKSRVCIDNFKATKSRGALFIQGTLINKSGNQLSNIEVDANGYDKNGILVSTDRVDLSPNTINNGEKINFESTFVKNVDSIDKYYFVGRYEMTKVESKVNMKFLENLGVVLLEAGAIVALSAAAYYGSSYYQSAPSFNSQPYIPINNIQTYVPSPTLNTFHPVNYFSSNSTANSTLYGQNLVNNSTRHVNEFVGTGNNLGNGWIPDGHGGFIGSGGNSGRGWEYNGHEYMGKKIYMGMVFTVIDHHGVDKHGNKAQVNYQSQAV